MEVDLLGLTLGIDPKDLALKLPLIGRVGLVRQADRKKLKGSSDAVRATVAVPEPSHRVNLNFIHCSRTISPL